MAQAEWTIPDNDLVDLTPARARDLIIECFYHAQRETFARTRQKLGSARVDDATLRADVASAVRVAFRESDGDFDRPTPASLASAVSVLARKAGSWGTPPDIVARHGAQIMAMLERLGRA